MLVSEDRKTQIQDLAMATALELIRNNLHSEDVDLRSICTRLRPFSGLLASHGLDEASARQFLDAGFRMVSFNPDPSIGNRLESLRLLDMLLDKLDSMKPLLGM